MLSSRKIVRWSSMSDRTRGEESKRNTLMKQRQAARPMRHERTSKDRLSEEAGPPVLQACLKLQRLSN